jgi:5'-3' exonuclease
VISSRLLLLDTASLYFRAFYGLPDSLRSPDGHPVNAVRGLLDFIARLVSQYRPTHLACCWDNDWRPARRTELLPTYKAHRVAGPGETGIPEMAHSVDTPVERTPEDLAVQVPMILQVLTAAGIAVIGHDGYEADDVIGTLAQTAANPAAGSPPENMAVDIVTGDRDLFQLVDDQRSIRVLYVARGVGKHDQVDDAWLQDRFGVPASGYRDFAILKGDPSDGLPGVAGIGDKTAASLITAHGSLEGILAAASRPDTSISASIQNKLGAAIDYLAVAPRVVGVVTDLDLGVTLDDLVLPSQPAQPDRFGELTDTLGLGGSANRMLAALGEQASD